MKIKINGIFHKYNNVIDLDKRLSIYIGENGVGKSTTINILYNIITGNFIDILKYNFESIDIDNIHIKYEDLVPSKEYIVENLKDNEYVDILNKLGDSYYKIIFKMDNDTSEKLDEIIHNIYSDYKEVHEVKIKFITSVKNIFYKNRDYDYEISIYDVYKNLKYNVESRFKDNKIYEKVYNKIKKFNNVLMYSMLDSNSISNGIVGIYQYEKRVINDEYTNETWYKDEYYYAGEETVYDEYGNCDDVKENSHITKERWHLSLKETQKCLKRYLEEHTNEEIIKNIKIKKGSNLLDIYNLMINYFYEENFIKEINNDYYNWLRKVLVNKEYDKSKESFFKNYSSNIFKSEHYLLPLLPCESIADIIAVNESDLYKKFLDKEIDKIVNYTNPKIEKLNNLLNKYFKNKKIFICPSGITISFNDDRFKSDITINDLSEGEKRLLLLLIISVINETKVLILDELEASLSIIWQKSIINDLMEYSDVKNIIVATQSPFIVPDEMMDDIICLPGDSNE